MTTLEEMAIDVFTDLYVFYSQEDGKTHTAGVDFDYRLSDYEMAQLNDLACDIWSRRYHGSYDEVHAIVKAALNPKEKKS